MLNITTSSINASKEDNESLVSILENSSCESNNSDSQPIKIDEIYHNSCGEDKESAEAVTRGTDASFSGSHEGKRMMSGGIQTIVIMNKSTKSKFVFKARKNKEILKNNEIVSSCLKPVHYK